CRIEHLIQPLRESGEIESTFQSAGNNGQYNTGFMVMTLAPWEERERNQQQIVAEIRELTKQVPSLRIFPIQPNSLGIRGAGSGLQFALVGNDRAALSQAAVIIDRERASDLGIPITGLADTMQAMLDGKDIG